MSEWVVYLEFDDVLAETAAHRRSALRAALAAEGVEFADDQFDSVHGGLSLEAAASALCRLAGTPLDATALSLVALRADREFAARVARGLSLMPGAAAFVRDAAARVRLAVVTRAARRDVEHTLTLSDLADSFTSVHTREDYSGAEPSPEPWGLASVRMAARGGITSGREIAMVASINGVAAARAAHMIPVVVGAVAPNVAFAGDGYLPTLEGVRLPDLIQLADAARTL